MADGKTAQAKGPDHAAMRIEDAAYDLLNEVLPASLKKPMREAGGVIHRNISSGELGHTGHFFSEPGDNVKIKADEPNMGCPEGTVAVAWYHTHPYDKRGEWTYEAKAFIGNDEFISNNNNIPGYVGVFDGTFWRYDPPPEAGAPIVLDGTPLKPLPPGRFVQLNRKLKKA
jgi:uncharacterized protein DUF4329